jgi:hypothetical protein
MPPSAGSSPTSRQTWSGRLSETRVGDAGTGGDLGIGTARSVRAVTTSGRAVPATVEERFWAKVDKDDGTGCWLYTGRPNSRGYGWFTIGAHGVLVHRLAYELLVGPIPEGMTLDHVKERGCTSRLCVKAVADEHGPAHLEPVTNAENVLRGDGWGARNARKTHCPKGHPYSGANLRISPKGYRVCRECERRPGRVRIWRKRPRA